MQGKRKGAVMTSAVAGNRPPVFQVKRMAS